MDEIVVRGSPVELEVALGRALRAVQLAVALPITAVLWWLEAWWWLPVPLAASFLAYEAVFAPRRDQPTVLTLKRDRIELRDGLRGQELAVPCAAIEVATATWHRGRRGSEVVVMLATAEGPRLAIRFLLQTSPDRGPGDVDLDLVDRVLGGPGGQLPSVQAVAPFEVIGRQRFEDPRALVFLRQVVPRAAWERAGARVWVGEAPPLDPFGYHLGDPDGWLVADGDRWTLRVGEQRTEGTLRGARIAAGTRRARLVLRAGAEPLEVDVPLLVLALPDGPRLQVPAAPSAVDEEPRAADPSDHHTHFPEGGALVWHLLRHLAPTDLPPALVRASEGVPAGWAAQR